MKYDMIIRRAEDSEAVKSLEPVNIDIYPWYVEGLKQPTAVRAGWNDRSILIHVEAVDRHSSAEVLGFNGPVYADSCFEFFFTPDGKRSQDYINLEVNCIGTVYLATRTPKGMRLAQEGELEMVKVATSLKMGRKKLPEDDDQQWCLDIEIPFCVIESLWGRPVSKAKWFVNYYRCGGNIDHQYASWCPIKAPIPNFHLPEFFGEAIFASE